MRSKELLSAGSTPLLLFPSPGSYWDCFFPSPRCYCLGRLLAPAVAAAVKGLLLLLLFRPLLIFPVTRKLLENRKVVPILRRPERLVWAKKKAQTACG